MTYEFLTSKPDGR